MIKVIVILGVLLLAVSQSGAQEPATPLPTTTTAQVAGHCGFGPNDNDVRGVVRAATPTTVPTCR